MMWKRGNDGERIRVFGEVVTVTGVERGIRGKGRIGVKRERKERGKEGNVRDGKMKQ